MLKSQREALGDTHPDTMDSMYQLSLWRYRTGIASQQQTLVAEGRALAEQLMAVDLSSLPPELAEPLKAKHDQLQRDVWSEVVPGPAGGPSSS